MVSIYFSLPVSFQFVRKNEGIDALLGCPTADRRHGKDPGLEHRLQIVQRPSNGRAHSGFPAAQCVTGVGGSPVKPRSFTGPERVRTLRFSNRVLRGFLWRLWSAAFLVHRKCSGAGCGVHRRCRHGTSAG